MAYATGSDTAVPAQSPSELKILVAGGLGAGKSTLVAALSEIEPLSTEELLTVAGTGIDDLAGVDDKRTTTVALDFGRITFHDPLPMLLYLFGVPGQKRFWFLWPDLGYGALGAVVLVDTRRLQDSFTAVSWYEQQRLPFVVAVNEFDGSAHRYTPDEVRQALGLPAHVPVVTCDARDHNSAVQVLIILVRHSLDVRRAMTSGALV
ncbi:ATP/GTP-binding protein [Streptomyces sp. NPDC001553]|uniref:GTP-binding protein n=1 Tax=Streptomyces sp. NPDC001553 TaxID=3154385 RepID=UPI00331C36D7